ncbi:MAG: pentapeptide repeat-containing protein, partial [Myxococcota bacterium]|nr:pentapeptide repeat-containing protein [Myxococcota bacterium]
MRWKLYFSHRFRESTGPKHVRDRPEDSIDPGQDRTMRGIFSSTRSVAPFLFSERGSLQLTRSLRHTGGGAVRFSEDEDQSHLSLSGEHSGHDLSGRQIADSRASSSDCQLTSLQLEQATWLRCILRRVRMSDLKADRSCWEVVDLEGATFTSCSARQARFSLVSFRDAQLQDMDLSGSTFILCDFSGSSWRRVNLEGARFVGCDFEGAVFEEGVNLAGADLRSNSLRRTWLGGADLLGARVSRADFRGALGLSGRPTVSKVLEEGGALLSKPLLGSAWQTILGSGPSAHRRVRSAV